MEVSVENIGNLTRKVTVTLPESMVQPRIEAEYEKLRKDVKMKGFRRGKVPRTVIVKGYKPQVQSEVGEKLVQDTYFEAIEGEKLDPVTHPEITAANHNDDGSFTYTVNVDIRPVFELGDYKGIEVEKAAVVVTDAEVDQELAAIQKEMAALQSVTDRAVAQGDVVIVDFQGYHKGNAIKQVKNDNYSVDVGSGKMGAEFEAKLVGMKLGEESTHEVEYPDSHPNPFLKGRTIEFKITVKDIKERVLAAIDDEFAKDVSPAFTSLEELKNSIRERRIKDRTEMEEGAFTDRIMQKLLEKHDFEVPNRLVVFEIEQMIKQTEQQLEKSGLNLEAAGISREKLVEQNAPVATKRVRGDFILKKIAEAEGIKVEEEDLERGFKRIGDQYKMSVAQVKEFFQSRNDLLPFMNELLNEKILDFLRKEAVRVEPLPQADVAAAVESEDKEN